MAAQSFKMSFILCSSRIGQNSMSAELYTAISRKKFTHSMPDNQSIIVADCMGLQLRRMWQVGKNGYKMPSFPVQFLLYLPKH